MTMTEALGWMEGSFFLVSHSKFEQTGMGGAATAYFGYDPDKKVYTYDEFTSMGEAVHSTGTLEGNTWTWLGDLEDGHPDDEGDASRRWILSPTSVYVRV